MLAEKRVIAGEGSLAGRGRKSYERAQRGAAHDVAITIRKSGRERPAAGDPQLVGEVLSGNVQPGDSLPSERRLAEVLGADEFAAAVERIVEATNS